MKRILGILVIALTLLGTQRALAAARPRSERLVTITVTQNGFEPAMVHLKAGQPVRLVVTRKAQRTCVTDIVIREFGIRKPLPLNKPVVVRFTPRKPGSFRYACAMDMVAGSLMVE